jgi:hypothetical protein
MQPIVRQATPEPGPPAPRQQSKITDRLLLAHQVRPRQFDLTVPWDAGIRTQMLRAYLAVERLHAEGLIGANLPLIVLGAGICGVTAALTARRLGVRTVLVEQFNQPLADMTAVNRTIDPVGLDWPHPHWNLAAIPQTGNDQLPLPFDRRPAGLLADAWLGALERWIDEERREALMQSSDGGRADGRQPTAPGAHLEIWPGVDANEVAIHDADEDDFEGILVTHKTYTASRAVRFGAALSCIGGPEEQVDLPVSLSDKVSRKDGEPTPTDYRSLCYWGADTLDATALGLGDRLSAYTPANPFRILVSGGGDGAQEDIQRALTGTAGAALMERLERHLPPAGQPLLNAVLAEDATRRAHQWRAAHQQLRHGLCDCDAAYTAYIDHVWSHWAKTDQLPVVCADILMARPGLVHVSWVVGGDVPDLCRALNRVLCALTLRLHAWQTGRPFRSDGVPTGREAMILGYWTRHAHWVPADGGLADDAATHHQCGNPKACLGIPHRVGLTTVMIPGPGELPLWVGPYHLVLIRHGRGPTAAVNHRGLWGRPMLVDELGPYGLPS